MAERKAKRRAGQGKRRTAAQPKRWQESQLKSARVLTTMRSENVSLAHAAREEGISPATVLRHAKGALRKTTQGRYKARKSDRLARSLVIPTPTGLAEIATMDSRAATVVGEYWNAVNTYLETGDETDLSVSVGYRSRRTRQTSAAAHRYGRTRAAGGRRRPVLSITLRKGQLSAGETIERPNKSRRQKSEGAAAGWPGRRLHAMRRIAARGAGHAHSAEAVPAMLPAKRGKKITETHHVAGKANSPITSRCRPTIIGSPQCRSTGMDSWNARNADGSPLLRLAAALNGTADIIEELIRRLIESSRSSRNSMDGCAKNMACGGRAARLMDGSQRDG